MTTCYRRLVAIPGLVCLTLALNPAAASLSASKRDTEFHLTKDCAHLHGCCRFLLHDHVLERPGDQGQSENRV